MLSYNLLKQSKMDEKNIQYIISRYFVSERNSLSYFSLQLLQNNYTFIWPGD